MKKKRAIITLELVDESIEEENDKIKQELLKWLREDAAFIPWVKNIKNVIVENQF
ncbi:hypothetical protein J7L33_02345 [Candidatus Bathyarchaeota archaeon]|nr:hypothetical protein [Candidatus Bathyarchaeota archaeon]